MWLVPYVLLFDMLSIQIEPPQRGLPKLYALTLLTPSLPLAPPMVLAVFSISFSYDIHNYLKLF